MLLFEAPLFHRDKTIKNYSALHFFLLNCHFNLYEINNKKNCEKGHFCLRDFDRSVIRYKTIKFMKVFRIFMFLIFIFLQ